MNWIVLSGIVAIGGLALWVMRTLPGRRGKPARVDYQKRDFLLSPEERLFFTALKQAVGDQYEIFGKIQVRDVVSSRSGPGRPSPLAEYEVLEGRHFAFVLLNPADLSIACAVQLREHSWGGKQSQASTDPLKFICHAAGLPFVIFEAGPLYDANEIRELIAAAVHKEPLYFAESDGRKEPRISGLENFEL
jgi:hypothetical protein